MSRKMTERWWPFRLRIRPEQRETVEMATTGLCEQTNIERKKFKNNTDVQLELLVTVLF